MSLGVRIPSKLWVFWFLEFFRNCEFGCLEIFKICAHNGCLEFRKFELGCWEVFKICELWAFGILQKSWALGVWKSSQIMSLGVCDSSTVVSLAVWNSWELVILEVLCLQLIAGIYGKFRHIVVELLIIPCWTEKYSKMFSIFLPILVFFFTNNILNVEAAKILQHHL